MAFASKKHKISIVTPSYNSGKYIRETITSVLSQDFHNFEYFVIDGGSTDNTIEILREFGKDERYKDIFKWISEKDEGQADAINKGLRMCTGDWFAYINADDFYEPDVFNKLASYMRENMDKGVIYGNQLVIFDGLDEKYNMIQIPNDKIDFQSMIYGNQIYGPASFYNMKALKKVGEFDVTLYHWMDWDMYLRISKIMAMKYVDVNISTFRISKDMKSPSNPDNKKAYKRFVKEAHKVSVKHGGKYFSGRWLQRFIIYGKYKYYLRRIYKEKSVQGHDRLDNAKTNKVILVLVYAIHHMVKIFKRLLSTGKKHFTLNLRL